MLSPKITVVGSTTWGTTLSVLLTRNDIATTLLVRSLEESKNLIIQRENKRLLPGISIPESLFITHEANKSLPNADIVILAVPSQTFRQNLIGIKNYIKDSSVIVSASKGLEMNTGKRMTEIVSDILNEHSESQICALSGPNLATEILNGEPSSTVVASVDIAKATLVQEALISTNFRVYKSDDVVGVELGGSLKNVIALGAGMSDGVGYGHNTKAALITRGLAEITHLGVAAGAKASTFSGLTGLGDLIATSSSPLSRNYAVGKQIGQGQSLTDILKRIRNVAEGVHTTSAALKLSRVFNVPMPITQATYSILFEGMDIKKAITMLMGRPPTIE